MRAGPASYCKPRLGNTLFGHAACEGKTRDNLSASLLYGRGRQSTSSSPSSITVDNIFYKELSNAILSYEGLKGKGIPALPSLPFGNFKNRAALLKIRLCRILEFLLVIVTALCELPMICLYQNAKSRRNILPRYELGELRNLQRTVDCPSFP